MQSCSQTDGMNEWQTNSSDHIISDLAYVTIYILNILDILKLRCCCGFGGKRKVRDAMGPLKSNFSSSHVTSVRSVESQFCCRWHCHVISPFSQSMEIHPHITRRASGFSVFPVGVPFLRERCAACRRICSSWTQIPYILKIWEANSVPLPSLALTQILFPQYSVPSRAI